LVEVLPGYLGFYFLDLPKFCFGKKTEKLHVVGKDMLCTLDDIFWMPPFSSNKQEQITRQENQVTDEEWQRHGDLITAKHRFPAAREQLEQQWKA
jgi:hypothetical protein